jgi:hypothetical protein
LKEVINLNRDSIRLLVVAVVMTGASACASAPPAPTPPPKPAATTPPTAAPAAPTAAPTAAAKPAAAPTTAAPTTAAKPAAAPTTAAKPEAALAVNKPANAAGNYKPADTLIVYGDTVLFGDPSTNPDVCILKSRYAPGEGIGFRMTALDPTTGKWDESAELTVKVNYAGKTESVAMRYRGAGSNPHVGMWTGKWVVPDDAPAGVVKYTVEAKDSTGRSGTWQPFNVEQSMLTIVR